MSLSLTHKALDAVIGFANKTLKPQAPDLFLKAAVKLRSDLDVVVTVATRRGPIRIYCDSETVRTRAEHMPAREPETLTWVEGFQPDEVFWDIGSNIGVYSLYAAVGSRCRVVAFDPLPFNFAGLCRNLELNNVTDRVMPFCLAVSDATTISTLYIPPVAYTPGGSGSTIGAPPEDFGIGSPTKVAQTMLCVSIDDFIERFNPPFPNHLKMDIDGVQDKVIAGGRKTLRDPRLRSAMLELPPSNESMVETVRHDMAAAGFVLTAVCETAPGQGTDPAKVYTNNFFEKR